MAFGFDSAATSAAQSSSVESANVRAFKCVLYAIGSTMCIVFVLIGLKKYNRKLRKQLFFTGVTLVAAVVATPFLDRAIDLLLRLVVNGLEDVVTSCLPSFATDGVDVHQGLQLIRRTRSLLPSPSVLVFVCAGNIAIQEYVFTALKISNENRRRIMNGRVAAVTLSGIVIACAAYLSSTRGVLVVLSAAAFTVFGLSIYFMQLPSHQFKWGKLNHVVVMVLSLFWTEFFYAAVQAAAFPDSTLENIGFLVTWCNFLLAVVAPFCIFNHSLERHVLVLLVGPPSPARAPPPIHAQPAAPGIVAQ